MKTVKELKAELREHNKLLAKVKKDRDKVEKALDKVGVLRNKLSLKKYALEELIQNTQERELEEKTLPTKGSFICYKKIRHTANVYALVKLRVPAKAARVSPYHNSGKCRVSEAVVLSITSLKDGKSLKTGRSDRDITFIYKVGAKVEADWFDYSKNSVCTGGIHVFLHKKDAKNYDFT